MARTRPQDVRDRWIGDKALTETDAQITTFIEDAEDKILGRVPDLEDRLQSGKIPHGRLVRIVAGVVERRLRNPDYTRQIQETTGPFTNSRTTGGDRPGELYVTDEELAELLGPQVRTVGRRAFTIMPRLR